MSALFTLPPKVTAPLPVLSARWAFNASPVLLSPKLMSLLVVATWPPNLRLLGAVADKPPANARLSVAALPNVNEPVLRNVVAALIVVMFPSKIKW